MSTLKLIQCLTSRTLFRILICLRPGRNASLSFKSKSYFNIKQVHSLSSKKSLSCTDEAETNKDVEDDYFGVEYHSSVREKEHAIAKEAWLETLENPDLNSEDKVSKVEPSKETEDYDSELVTGLVKDWKTKKSKEENIVTQNYGWIRYDNKIPNKVKEMDVLRKRKMKAEKLGNENLHKDERESGVTESNRFARSHDRILRQSQRKLGQRNTFQKLTSEMGGMNKNRFANLQVHSNSDDKTGLSFIEEQYFHQNSSEEQFQVVSDSVGQKMQSENLVETQVRTHKETCTFTDKTNNENDLSFIDQQYFMKDSDVTNRYSMDTNLASQRTVGSHFQLENEGNKIKLTDRMETLRTTKATKFQTSVDDAENRIGSEFIDDQYFGYKSGLDNSKDRNYFKSFKEEEDEQLIDDEKSLKSDKDTRLNRMGKKRIMDTLSTEVVESNSGAVKLYEKRLKSNLTEEKPKKGDLKKPESAQEAAMQKRMELEQKSGMRLFGRINAKKLDQQGFRVLSGQVPDFTNVPARDIAGVLRNSIIYNDNDIVAINKPYGLSSRGGPDLRVSIEQLLGDIIPEIRLHLVSGISKETTGVLLLAKTLQMARKLEIALKREETVKRYLVITKNVPKLPRGEINIPVGDGLINGKVRKKLKPYGDSDIGISSRISKNAERAVTRYEVLSHQEAWALIECWPLTNVKHQVRVHLALGLNCPILGDHKYSHFDKIAPMKLPKNMLDKLHVRQSKVRDIAMHIHGTAVIIPEFLDGRNLIITAPLPPHFIKNMKSLNLKMPPGKFY